MPEEGVRCESRTAPWAGAHPGKVMTFRDWGRGRLPHLGAGGRPTWKAPAAVGKGRGRFSEIGNPLQPHAPHP